MEAEFNTVYLETFTDPGSYWTTGQRTATLTVEDVSPSLFGMLTGWPISNQKENDMSDLYTVTKRNYDNASQSTIPKAGDTVITHDNHAEGDFYTVERVTLDYPRPLLPGAKVASPVNTPKPTEKDFEDAPLYTVVHVPVGSPDDHEAYAVKTSDNFWSAIGASGHLYSFQLPALGAEIVSDQA